MISVDDDDDDVPESSRLPPAVALACDQRIITQLSPAPGQPLRGRLLYFHNSFPVISYNTVPKAVPGYVPGISSPLLYLPVVVVLLLSLAT